MNVPMILAVAPTGARRTKADHQTIPISPAEIASEATNCLNNGAALLHLHVRSNKQSHSIDPGAYSEAIKEVRNGVGDQLIIQITTEAAGIFSRNQQIETASAVNPDSISLAVREICANDDEIETASALYAALYARGVLVQHIAYDENDIVRLKRLRDTKVIPEAKLFVQIVLGQYGEGRAGGPDDFARFFPLLRNNNIEWSVCCFGSWEPMAVAAAAALGGHARVGFENNVYAISGALAMTNAKLVEQSANIIRATGRTLATAADIRAAFSCQMIGN